MLHAPSLILAEVTGIRIAGPNVRLATRIRIVREPPAPPDRRFPERSYSDHGGEADGCRRLTRSEWILRETKDGRVKIILRHIRLVRGKASVRTEIIAYVEARPETLPSRVHFWEHRPKANRVAAPTLQTGGADSQDESRCSALHNPKRACVIRGFKARVNFKIDRRGIAKEK